MCSTDIWLINWYFKHFVDKTLPSTEWHQIHIGNDDEGKPTYSWSLTNPHLTNSGVVWKTNALPFRLREWSEKNLPQLWWSCLASWRGQRSGASTSATIASDAASAGLYAHWLSDLSTSGMGIKSLVHTRTVSLIGTHSFSWLTKLSIIFWLNVNIYLRW